MSEPISITRALAQLKTLTARIESAITASIFVGVKAGKDSNTKVLTPKGNLALTAVEDRIKSEHKSLDDLITERSKLKSAIAISNSATRVTIGGVSMSVAEAIERKHTLPLRVRRLEVMRTQYNNAVADVALKETQLAADIDKGVQSLYAGGDPKSKPTAEDYATIEKPRRDRFEPSLIDPLNLAALIKKEADEIQTFVSEVDFVLSESNAQTKITVSA